MIWFLFTAGIATLCGVIAGWAACEESYKASIAAMRQEIVELEALEHRLMEITGCRDTIV